MEGVQGNWVVGSCPVAHRPDTACAINYSGWVTPSRIPGLLFLIVLAAQAQTGVPPAGGIISSVPPAPTPPPPPPVKLEKKPEIPRVRVPPLSALGVGVCHAPAQFWVCPQRSYACQVKECEQRVMENPEDICARGELISRYRHGEPTPGARQRTSHLLWMIRNHPEWDGFTAAPEQCLALPRSTDEPGSYDKLKDAWEEKIGSPQRRAIVLHNAAIFFAKQDPKLAVKLLERAIRLEPKESLYTERLGMMYAYLLLPQKCVIKGDPFGRPEFRKLARKGRKLFARSNDWVFLAGGLTAGYCYCHDQTLDRYLRDRLKELGPGNDPRGWGASLPSLRSQYCQTDCRPLADDSPRGDFTPTPTSPSATR